MKKLLKKILPKSVRDFLNFISGRNIVMRNKILRRINAQAKAYYTDTHPTATNSENLVISMVNEQTRYGGLADRLRGMLAVYKTCKKNGVAFRIYHDYPFMLEDYLLPNEYEWRIKKSDVSYNIHNASPFLIWASPVNENANKKMEKKIDKAVVRNNNKQLHIHTNALYAMTQEYSVLFNELFKPAAALQREIDYHYGKLSMNGRYCALAFRFLNLMGDFNEKDSPLVLSLPERTALMQKCLNEIYTLKKRCSGCNQFLVTSDSISFLKEAAKIDFVYTIPGDIVHCDNTNDRDFNLHLKTFVDFFMISKADKVFLLCTDNMYKSGFSQNAALVNNVPFEIVYF